MLESKRPRRWIWAIFGIIVLVSAGIGLTVVYQSTVQGRILAFNNAASALDCLQAQKSAQELTGIYRYGVDSGQSAVISEFLEQCNLLEQARSAVQAGEFSAAQTQFWALATQYPSSPFVPTVSMEAQEAFLRDAETKQSGGDYEEALNMFAEFLADYPASPYAQRAQDGYMSTLQEWVTQLMAEGEYAQASSTCGTYAVEAIPETIDWCSQQKPVILFEWGKSLYAEGKTGEAQPLFFEMLSLVDSTSPLYAEMLENYPEVMIAWSVDLRLAGKFQQSLDVLTALKEKQTGKEILARIGEEYSATLLALANDSEGEGKALLQKTISDLCSKAVKPPLHPAVGILTDLPGKGDFCRTGDGSSAYFPSSRYATKPGELKYYILFSDSADLVGKCFYTGDHTLLVKRKKMTVYVNLVSTRKTVYQKLFYGSYPPPCPKTYSFGSQREKEWAGNAVDPGPVKYWLETVIK